MKTKEMVIEKCRECPFVSGKEVGRSLYCTAVEGSKKKIGNVRVPLWCPLYNTDIVVRSALNTPKSTEN